MPETCGSGPFCWNHGVIFPQKDKRGSGNPTSWCIYTNIWGTFPESECWTSWWWWRSHKSMFWLILHIGWIRTIFILLKAFRSHKPLSVVHSITDDGLFDRKNLYKVKIVFMYPLWIMVTNITFFHFGGGVFSILVREKKDFLSKGNNFLKILYVLLNFFSLS